jgi:hypothetical protein
LAGRIDKSRDTPSKPAPCILSRFEIETSDRPYLQADPLRSILQCGNMRSAFVAAFAGDARERLNYGIRHDGERPK